MRFGLFLPPFLDFAEPRRVIELARTAGVAGILDEALDLLQRLLSGEPVRFDGRHYAVRTSGFQPRPVQDPVPTWAACRWPNRRPLARAAGLQGCFPIFPAAGPPSPPDPAAVSAIRQALMDLGAEPGFDLVVRTALSLEDPTTIAATVDELERAGATWVLDSFGPGEPSAAAVEEAIRNGPPPHR